MGYRVLLALLLHLCIHSCYLYFLYLKASSWRVKRGNTRTDIVSNSLLSGAAVCMFLMTLLSVPETWKACTRFKDLDPPSEPITSELLYSVFQ